MNLPHKIEDVERDILNLLGNNFVPVVFDSGRKGYYLKHPVIISGAAEYATVFIPELKVNNKKTPWIYSAMHDKKLFKKLSPWLPRNRANDFHVFLEVLCDKNRNNDQNIKSMFAPEVLRLIDIWKNDSL